MEVMKLAATVLFVHQVNSDAQVDSASQQARDVMVCLDSGIVQIEVMRTAVVHQTNSVAQVDSASHHTGDVIVSLTVKMEVMRLAAIVHHINSDAQMDSASQQAPDVMMYLIV